LEKRATPTKKSANRWRGSSPIFLPHDAVRLL
jgi:hypothetical protein